jgi:hypothetical protein
MKKICIIGIMAAICGIAQATTITLYQGSYSYSVGGEFTAIASPSLLGNGYVPSTEVTVNGQTGFQTFCLETGVYLNPGTQYYYTLGTTTQPLSGGGAGSDLPLSAGAAYLYYEFATGQLAGYNYANSGPGLSRKDDAGLLQAAIWYLQGGQTKSGYPDWSTDPFYTLALANANSSYLSYVDVLQLWSNSNDTGAVQNQLVLTGTRPPPSPVPDGGMTVVLLGSALVGLQTLRRKLVS